MNAGKALPVRREEIGHIGPLLTLGVADLSLGLVFGDLGAVAQHRHVGAHNGLKHIGSQPRSRGEQLILKVEAVVSGGEIQVRQTLFRQEAQGQVGPVFQQMHLIIVVHLLKHTAGPVPVIPLDHIFQIQEQVRHRAALLEAVAVVGVFRPIAQGLHKLRHLHVGGAGKGRDAVVAIQRVVVQGLGVGGLRPVEAFFFPLLHIPDHGGRGLRSLGIVGDSGAREIQAEGQQIRRQLQHRDPQYRPAGVDPIGALPVAQLGQGLRRGILRHSYPDPAIEQGRRKGKEESPIIQ